MMSTAPTPPRTSVPPEELFWQRYSPHHEFPLSSATSVALHVLVLVLFALAAWWIARMTSAEQRPLYDQPVFVTGRDSGIPGGAGDNRAGPGDANPIEELGPKQGADAAPITEPPRKELTAPGATPTPVVPPVSDDDAKKRLIIDARRSDKETRERLREGLRPGKDKVGPGGAGKDKGDGLGSLKERETRMGRWVMLFETDNGDDYARQLASLGAFLAIPEREGETVAYRVLRDLNARPAHGKIEDLADIKRIWWEDAKRESITPLCLALGIRLVPDHVLAFFPTQLERRLLSMELGHKGLKEEQIEETRFKVRKTATGYEPVVIEQKAK